MTHTPAVLDDDTSIAAPSAPARARPGLNTDTLALGGVFIALFAFLASVFAVGLAGRAIDEHQNVAAMSTGGGGGGTAATVAVALEEFAIAPQSLQVAAGAVLDIVNRGAVVHNLSVDGVASPMIDGGASTRLDLSSLAAGSYTMRCDVPGHEAAGMSGSITIG